MIQTETARNEYTGNASLAIFPYSFRIFDKSEILVLLDSATAALDTDYTVSNVGDEAGGEIMFSTPPGVGVAIIFLRQVPATQLVDLNEGQPFDAEINETEYDRLTMMLQQVRETLTRALKFSPWSRKKNIDVPDPVTGKVLAWDSVGNLINQDGGVDGRAFIWRGPWGSGTAYAIDDVVSFQGSSYIAILASVGVNPTTTSTWQLLAQKGADGGSGGVTMSDATPAPDAASGAPGGSTSASRGDHSHAHPNTGSFLADAHHPKSHVHTGDGSGTVVHASLGSIGADDHHPQIHGLVSGNHTVSGLTTGDVLTALSATTFGFQAPAGGGGGGSGDVIGPSGAIDGHLALFDGTTGKLIKDGGALTSADFTTQSFISDEFQTGVTGNHSIGQLLWSFSGFADTGIASVAGHPGIHSIATSNAAGTSTAMSLQDGGQAIFVEADIFSMHFVCNVVQLTNSTMRAGLYRISQTPTLNPPSDGMYFEYIDGTDTNWQAVCRAGGTSTRTDTGVAAATGWIKFRVRRIDGTHIGFTIGSNSEVVVTSNIPTGSGAQPVLHITATTSTQRTFQIDYFDLLITGLSR